MDTIVVTRKMIEKITRLSESYTDDTAIQFYRNFNRLFKQFYLSERGLLGRLRSLKQIRCFVENRKKNGFIFVIGL